MYIYMCHIYVYMYIYIMYTYIHIWLHTFFHISVKKYTLSFMSNSFFEFMANYNQPKTQASRTPQTSGLCDRPALLGKCEPASSCLNRASQNAGCLCWKPPFCSLAWGLCLWWQQVRDMKDGPWRCRNSSWPWETKTALAHD